MKLWLIRNSDGRYFRAKGYSGYGSTWVDVPEKARVYMKLSQARSRITYFANHYPTLPVPQLVEFDVTEVGVVSDAKHREAAQRRQENKETERARMQKHYAEEKLRQAEGGEDHRTVDSLKRTKIAPADRP